jgi:hypothetical protein
LTPIGHCLTVLPVAEEQAKRKRQIGPRVDDDLIKEVRILGIRQGKLLEDLVEEALRDLLKKHREKSKGK